MPRLPAASCMHFRIPRQYARAGDFVSKLQEFAPVVEQLTSIFGLELEDLSGSPADQSCSERNSFMQDVCG